MSLIMALRCSDAIVVASDGQLTADTAGQPTRLPSRKLFDIGERVAWGAAGSVGLQQTLQEELVAMNGSLADSSPRLRERLASTVIPIQQRGIEHFVALPGTDPPVLVCLFCWWDREGGRILEIPRTGGDHQFHDRFAAIGTGEIFAKFAIGSLVGTEPAELDLERAKMVAYRAVAEAIDVAAMFLGPPIQMYVVDRDGARAVPREELDGGLADSVGIWKARQLEALGPLSAPSARRARLASTG
ncbi:MAG: proteasome beta subunit [Solirubrobacterales bacterium]|jgi:20S proteasome alpha/beta subunit|nr:proteasome beta subunit [Solirubrobacterales bacterium]